MKNIQIVVEGVSEEQIQKDIERNTRGWRLFFEEPKDASYEFLSPFWGFHWDGTSENLKEIITKGTRVGDKNKHHICLFKYNGEDRFAWCSWTKEVYDFNTKTKHQLEGKGLARKIVELIEDILDTKLEFTLRDKLSALLMNTSEEHHLKVHIPLELEGTFGLSTNDMITVEEIWQHPTEGIIMLKLIGINDPVELEEYEESIPQIYEYINNI